MSSGSEARQDATASATVQLLHMVAGAWVGQAVHVAAKLGIADVLESGPKTPSEIATATGSHPGPSIDYCGRSRVWGSLRRMRRVASVLPHLPMGCPAAGGVNIMNSQCLTCLPESKIGGQPMSDSPIPIACTECSNQIRKTFEQLVANEALECPACGHRIGGRACCSRPSHRNDQEGDGWRAAQAGIAQARSHCRGRPWGLGARAPIRRDHCTRRCHCVGWRCGLVVAASNGVVVAPSC